MVIYADSLLAVNSIVNYLLLTAAARLGGVVAPRWRRGLAAVFGALYALLALLPRCRALAMLSVKLLCCTAMSAICFGRQRLLRQTLLVLALSALYGGLLLAIETLLGGGVTVLGGLLLYPVSFPVMLLTAGAVWLLFSTVFARMGAHSGGDLVQAEIWLDGRSVSVQAFRDTGNNLRDSITGNPVLVTEWESLRPLLANAPPALPQDPVSALDALRQVCPANRLRLTPYRSVGISGLLPTIRCDRILLDKQVQPGALAALSPTPVSDGGAYHALTGGV